MKTLNTDTTTNVTVKVPDYTAGTEIVTQYGMRYPDGTIKWHDDGGMNSRVYFEKLHRGDGGAAMAWEDKLTHRAATANIDRAEYAAQHTALKRTVILVTTVNEEV